MKKTVSTRSSPAPASLTSLHPSSSKCNTERASKAKKDSETSPDKYTEEEFGDESPEMARLQLMQAEKGLYPGAKSWAQDEERLFEILFMRQDLPMLPADWDVDLSGVPISDVIFGTSKLRPAIIYAHSRHFQATRALMRLIDTTANVRTTTQSGLWHKVPRLIKSMLDKYLKWAAQDAGYHHLRIVPNIVTEIIDSSMTGEEITLFMQSRMRALTRLQREFLRVDRDARFWEVVKPSLLRSPRIKMEDEDASPASQSWPTPVRSRRDSCAGELSTDESSFDGISIKVEPGSKKRRLFPSPTTDGSDADESAVDDQNGQRKRKRRKTSTPKKSPRKPKSQKRTPQVSVEGPYVRQETPKAPPETPQKPVSYRRPPPVVYGLFILNSSVFLLTADSSKGDAAYISFHVETDFHDKHQSVWNALTIAIAVCLARDELRTRMEDFEPVPVEVESDPDA